MTIAGAAWAMALAVLAAACAGGEGGSASAGPAVPTLAGTAWLAEDIDGGGVLDRVQTTVSFPAAGRITGSGGCNRYTGAVELQGETIRTGALAATRMACPPAVMQQESRFFEALAAAVRWRTTAEGKLLLLDVDGRTRVVFASTPPEAPPVSR